MAKALARRSRRSRTAGGVVSGSGVTHEERMEAYSDSAEGGGAVSSGISGLGLFFLGAGRRDRTV